MGMIRPPEPAIGQSYWRFRMAHGQDVLDAWSEKASQPNRNAVYRLLFAVQDGSVFTRYDTVDDAGDLGFSVHLAGDVVVRIKIDDDEAFTIDYIGWVSQPSVN